VGTFFEFSVFILSHSPRTNSHPRKEQKKLFSLYCVQMTLLQGDFEAYIKRFVYFNIVQCSGTLIHSDHQLYRVTPLKMPFGLLLPLLQSQSHVTAFTQNYFLRCYSCTQLTITYSTLARLHSLRALHSNLYCTIAHKVS
jgi:hypothetical protein